MSKSVPADLIPSNFVLYTSRLKNKYNLVSGGGGGGEGGKV